MTTIKNALLTVFACFALLSGFILNVYAEHQASATIEQDMLKQNGEPLTDLAGFRVYYSVDDNPPLTTYSSTGNEQFVSVTVSDIQQGNVFDVDIPLEPRVEPYIIKFGATAVRVLNNIENEMSDPVVYEVQLPDIAPPVRATIVNFTFSCTLPNCTATQVEQAF